MPPIDDNETRKAIRAIYNTNKIAKVIFDEFATRARAESEHTIDRLMDIAKNAGVPAARWEVVRLAKDQLAGIPVCKFISGRRGKDTRVGWSFDIVSLGRCANGTEEAIEPSSGAVVQFDGKGTDNQAMMTVLFPLRPLDGLNASITIPRALSQAEAQRLADFIKTLPER